MDDPRKARERTTRLLILAARALSSGVAAFWIYLGISSALNIRGPWPPQAVGMALLIVATVGSAVFAYRSPGLGGVIVLLCGVAQGIAAHSMSGTRSLAAAFVAGSPMALAGILFLVSWSRARRERPEPEPPFRE